MRDKIHKPFELVDVDESGMAFYNSIEEATDAALHYWNLRWGWSIWRIEQNGKRSLWVQTETENDFSWPYLQPVCDAIWEKVKEMKDA